MANWWDGLPTPSDAQVDAIDEYVIPPTSSGERRRWTDTDGLTLDEIRTTALLYHTFACRSAEHGGIDNTAAMRQLISKGTGWTRDELLFALYRAATAWTAGGDSGYLEAPIGIAGRMDPALWRDLRPVMEQLFAWLERARGLPSASQHHLLKVLGQALDGQSGLPRTVLHRGDGFGPSARAAFADEFAGVGVAPLLVYCATADRPVPTKKWLTELDRLLADAPTVRDVARALLRHFAASPQYLHADNDRLLRGLAWCLTDEDIELLAQLAVAASATAPQHTGYPYAPAAAATAVTLLGRDTTGELPVRTLARLSLTVKNKALNSRVQAALAELGALRGWSPSEVLELAVDDHGLDPDGTLSREVGDYVATVRIDDGKARLTFTRDGRSLSSVPAPVKQHHDEELKALKQLVKQIDATLATERARVEGLLSEEREWSYDDWVRRMLAHPVTGMLGRRLIFETTVDGSTWTAGLPTLTDDGWALVGHDGGATKGERFRLWHPIRAAIADVRAWRAHVVESGLRQPFKQAFREVYLLTPAEEQTEAYSNRFAAHILRYRQANALMRTRGWRANYLGAWDGGYEGTATKEFGGGRWRASFYHELVEEDAQYRAQLCSTDQVRFERRDGAVWEPALVASVPPVVLSEAMRDVDLFVGVTSIAADPEWVDRGEDRFVEYWRTVAFGDLTPSAELRRDALSRLLPRTKIARQVDLEEKFLRVRGSLRTYRIHLGSGNILMEPNDAYLCIVAARGKNTSIRLPFEDDAMLSMILSKAFLLAADTKITDQTILTQINGS